MTHSISAPPGGIPSAEWNELRMSHNRFRHAIGPDRGTPNADKRGYRVSTPRVAALPDR